MQIRNYILAILVFCTGISVMASDSNQIEIKKIYGDAEYFYLYGDYEKALNAYQAILQENPDNANIHYKVGLCYMQFKRGRYAKEALESLEKAVQNVSIKHKDNYKENHAPAEAWVYYGDVLRLNFKFEEAKKAYQNYLKLVPGDEWFKAYIERESNNCETAKALIDEPVYLQEKNNLHDITRREAFESCPLVSEDEQIIVFSYGQENILPPDIVSISDQDQYQTDDIYFAVKQEGIWGNSVNISKDLGTNGKAMPVAMTPKGEKIFIVQDDKDDGNIYESEYIDGTWTRMKKLNKNINSKSWETHASISKDSKTLYFTSERKGGFGGFDIYKSELDENGEWSKAENLGPTINSKYDEDTPYLTRDNQSLYFSSQGHKNMGGFDIFVSEFNQSDWSTPKNVGYPLNTPGNDLFYITQSDGQLAFAPLNDDHLRNVASLTADNWFVVRERAPLISVNLEMFLSDNSDNPIQELFVDTTGIAISNFSNTANTLSFDVESGSYDLLVSALDTDTTQVHIDAIDKGEDYAMSLTANLTLLTVDSFAIEDLLAEETESQNTNLKANENTNVLASSQGKTAFKEIYFGFDKSVVQKDFMDEVESIYNEWLKDKTRTIAIDGYADPVGNAQYNLKLSQRRADAVKEALLHMGMSEDMIVATGKGETSENVNNYYNRKTVISFVK